MSHSGNFSKIDQLLKQMEEADKVGNGDVAAQNDGEVTVEETEEYVNFVLKELIEGRESLDQVTTIQPNVVAQEFNQGPQELCQVGGVGVATVNQSVPVVGHQPNATFGVFGFNHNGKQVAAEPVVATYQVAGQKVVIPFPVVPVAVPSQELATAPVPQATETAATPGPSDSKKRKLYEFDEFNDPQMEKKRRNAINAKNHRDKTKSKIQMLSEELELVKTERNALNVENQVLKTENGEVRTRAQQEREALLMEVIALREENARLRQQEQNVVQQHQHGGEEEQQSLQQEKIGMLDLFDLLSDDHFGC